MADVAYCTRQQVQDALAQADTFRTNARIDGAIRAASRQVWAATDRYFYPTTRTLYPEIKDVTGPILWLDRDYQEMISVASFTVDGNTYTEGVEFFLRPDSGPPFTSLRLMNTHTASFSSDDRGMVLIGEQGASNTTRPAGTLVGAITSSQTVIECSDSSLIGVGDLITIGSERMDVTGCAVADTTAALAGNLTANSGDRAVTVSDGTLLNEGERIAIGAERMFVESIAGNVLTVRRAENGSQLGTHATSDEVYAYRTLRVERAATGSTAATHADGATIVANDPPSLVKETALAFALVDLTQSQAAYGRVVGSGDNQRESSGRGLQQIVADLVAAHGRLRLGSA